MTESIYTLNDDAFDRWLEMCIPTYNNYELVKDTYYNYMVHVNPDVDPMDVIEECKKHMKTPLWNPRAGLVGKSKHEVISELLAEGFKRSANDKGERVFYIILPDHDVVNDLIYNKAILPSDISKRIKKLYDRFKF